MEEYYTTGTFAKMANVTVRTIRYYDKIGLLKPSYKLDNGYRQYNNTDFLKLQKIISLKQLGFTIEEIFPLLINDNENLESSFMLQRELINKRITQLNVLDEALKSAWNLARTNNLDWNRIIELVHLTNIETEIADQYRDSISLNVRINLHNRFSTNKIGWYNWLFSHLNFIGVYRLLEVGCGNGKLWENSSMNLRNREIFLSDSSSGMIDEVRSKLGKDFNCIVLSCEKIPFKNSYFDALIGNHVLFYLKDLKQGLSEIVRVLRPNGCFYCTTYGTNHMREISELVYEFDSRIKLSEVNLFNKFGLENGERILRQHFTSIDVFYYPDTLEVNEVNPLIEYILSCRGNQNEIIGKRMEEFKLFLNDKISENGHIKITKEAGLFICTK